MSLNLTDADRAEVEAAAKSGGGGLRARLEEALAAQRAAESELATLNAQQVIREHGLDLVEPKDLAGVEGDDLATKAQELQAQRLLAQEEAVRAFMARRGVEGDLDQLIPALGKDAQGAPAGKPTNTAARAARQLGGTPTGGQPPSTEGLSALDKMRLGLGSS